MTSPFPTPGGAVLSSHAPMIQTGIPFIGSIDFKNPLEIAIWGGVLVSLIFIKNDTAKILVPVGLIALRWQLGQIEL